MSKYLGYIAVMMVVTYLVRMLPITLFQKEIKNIYIKSFLYYVPFAVLGCMTFPAIFSATGNVVSSTVGTFTGIYFAYKEKSLVQVAVLSCLAAYVCSLLLGFIL